MECEEFFLLDWSPPDDPARPSDDDDDDDDAYNVEKMFFSHTAPHISVRLELKSRCGGHRASPRLRMSRFFCKALPIRKQQCVTSLPINY